MRSVTYSMGVSLDGYIVGPDGGFDWTVPDEEVLLFVTDETHGLSDGHAPKRPSGDASRVLPTRRLAAVILPGCAAHRGYEERAVALPGRRAGARPRCFAEVVDACRLEVAMEHCRVEIQAVGPGDRPALGVYPHLGEVPRPVLNKASNRRT